MIRPESAEPAPAPGAFVAEPPTTRPVAAAYAADIRSDGYVRNFTRVWGWRPDVLTAFQRLRVQLIENTALSPREVAVLVAGTAAARDDSYCALAWGAKLAKLAGEQTAADVLRGIGARLSEREAMLLSWCRQVVHDPNAAARSDVDRLREAGLDDLEIFEATAWIAIRLAFSTINDALGAQPDPRLRDDAPQPVLDAVTFGR